MYTKSNEMEIGQGKAALAEELELSYRREQKPYVAKQLDNPFIDLRAETDWQNESPQNFDD